jgi:hypothetical protein
MSIRADGVDSICFFPVEKREAIMAGGNPGLPQPHVSRQFNFQGQEVDMYINRFRLKSSICGDKAGVKKDEAAAFL